MGVITVDSEKHRGYWLGIRNLEDRAQGLCEDDKRMHEIGKSSRDRKKSQTHLRSFPVRSHNCTPSMRNWVLPREVFRHAYLIPYKDSNASDDWLQIDVRTHPVVEDGTLQGDPVDLSWQGPASKRIHSEEEPTNGLTWRLSARLARDARTRAGGRAVAIWVGVQNTSAESRAICDPQVAETTFLVGGRPKRTAKEAPGAGCSVDSWRLVYPGETLTSLREVELDSGDADVDVLRVRVRSLPLTRTGAAQKGNAALDWNVHVTLGKVSVELGK